MTKSADSKKRGILYIDMAYPLHRVMETAHRRFFEMRHSNGYFERVVGVHPLADRAGNQSRRIEITPFSDRQLIVEGTSEMLRLPKILFPLNLLVSQWRLVRAVKQLVLEENLSVIFSTDAYYSGLFGLLVRRITGRPLIVGVYGNQDELYEATGALAMPRLLPFRWLEKKVANFVLSRADLVVAASKNNMSFAVANGARGATAIIPIARNIEPCHFVPPESRDRPETCARLNISEGTPLLLYVGRLLALKHPDQAVRAMAVAIARYPNAMGLIAGTGPMRAQLEALIDTLEMNGRIHLIGLLDQEELSRLIPHCVTLSPLTGMALLESGLGGSPIVAFARDWQEEFVEDGVNGFIVPFLDNVAMGNKAADILGDRALWSRLARSSRSRAVEYCDIEHNLTREHAIFDQLLGRAAESKN